MYFKDKTNQTLSGIKLPTAFDMPLNETVMSDLNLLDLMIEIS